MTVAGLILASGSPRRRDMLAAAGLEFEVLVSPAEELHDTSMPLHLLCEENARLKAVAVSANHPGATVIGADTLVYIDQTPLGKPRDKQEARGMLAMLSGKTHQVCTGVCIAHGSEAETFHCITEVIFKTLTESSKKSAETTTTWSGCHSASFYLKSATTDFRLIVEFLAAFAAVNGIGQVAVHTAAGAGLGAVVGVKHLPHHVAGYDPRWHGDDRVTG